MQPFFSSVCRYFALTVLMFLTVSCCVSSGQDRDLACSSRLISFTSLSFSQSDFSRPEISSSKESFQKDVSDYLKREILRKQLITRAESFLALPANQKPDRAVESAVLVVERLLDFGLSPDDPFLVEKTNSLRSLLRSIDTSAGSQELFKFAPAIRTLERYRQTLKSEQLAVSSEQLSSNADQSNGSSSLLRVAHGTLLTFLRSVPTAPHALHAFLSNQFEAPTIAQRRLSALFGAESLNPASKTKSCLNIDSRKNLEKLLERWESDNLRLAYVQPRLRLISSPDEFLLVLGSAAVCGAASPGGSTTTSEERSSIVSKISINNSFSTESLRSLRTRGFVLIAQTVVLQV